MSQTLRVNSNNLFFLQDLNYLSKKRPFNASKLAFALVDCVWSIWTSWTGSCRSCYSKGQESSVALLFRCF